MTAAASALKPHAVAILGSLSTIDSELRGYQNPQADIITIATNTTGLQNIFCHAGRRFLAKHPVKLRILDSRSEATVEAVLRGTVDLGFGLKRFADLHADQLEIIPFMEDRIVCIAPEDHPLAGRERVDLNTVLRYDYLALQDHMPLSKAMRERAQACGARYEPLVQLPNFDQMIRYVESGIGVALLPASALRESARFDDEPIKPFVTIELDEPFSHRELAFTMRPNGRANELCRQLIATCRETVSWANPG